MNKRERIIDLACRIKEMRFRISKMEKELDVVIDQPEAQEKPSVFSAVRDGAEAILMRSKLSTSEIAPQMVPYDDEDMAKAPMTTWTSERIAEGIRGKMREEEEMGKDFAKANEHDGDAA